MNARSAFYEQVICCSYYGVRGGQYLTPALVGWPRLRGEQGRGPLFNMTRQSAGPRRGSQSNFAAADESVIGSRDALAVRSLAAMSDIMDMPGMAEIGRKWPTTEVECASQQSGQYCP